jgi:hypothetical protein
LTIVPPQAANQTGGNSMCAAKVIDGKKFAEGLRGRIGDAVTLLKQITG